MRIENNSAVSPVIGVILMVAITVILAAVIAAFVFGMTGPINKTKIVAITLSQIDEKTVTIMNMGGQDAGELSEVRITGDLLTLPADVLSKETGSTDTYELSTGIGKKHIVGIGVFKDGTESVLLDVWATRTIA